MNKITNKLIQNFETYLVEEEKADSTIEKYIRDITTFMNWIGKSKITKTRVLEYKKELMEKYAPASVNSILSSLNSFFDYNEWHECKVKTLKIQKQIFANNNKELSKAEYGKILEAAKSRKNKQLYYLIQTICSCGIRISELKYININAIKTGQALINCKNKMRVVILPEKLCKMLNKYAREYGIKSGPVFVTRNGNPLDRSNIWRMLKKLCEMSGVSKSKVFPHNFRHLFARTYYKLQKDIVRLADILGHTSINTTRVYTMETGKIHREQLQKLGLLLC